MNTPLLLLSRFLGYAGIPMLAKRYLFYLKMVLKGNNEVSNLYMPKRSWKKVNIWKLIYGD